MGYLRNKVTYSLVATLFALSVAGCSSSGGSNDNNDLGSSSHAGGVIDGYLRGATVFVDENNNTIYDSGEQNVATDNNGDFSLSGNIPDGTHVYAYGGTDLSTNAPFKGKLSAIYDAANNAVILSPLTTYVTALVDANASLSVSEAKAKVATALGISPADVTSDPMTKPQAFLAAQKVQKTIEVVATATGNTNFIQAYENVFTSLAQTQSQEFNTTKLVEKVNSDHSVAIDANVTKFLKTYVNTVDALVDENVSVDDLNSYGNILDSYAKVAQSAIENNTSLKAVQTQLEDLNTTEVSEGVAAGDYTDPVVAATDQVESAIDNNVTYLGANSNDDAITSNLVLTSPTAAPFNTNDLNLTWSSSNDAVVSSTDGAVHRNHLNDVNVILTAKVNNNLVTETREHNLTVKRIEAAPTAQDVNVTLDADSNVTINLADKIADLNDDALTIATSTPAHGTVTVDGKTIFYVPTVGYDGSDAITYTVTDATGRSDSATINIVVNKIIDAGTITDPTGAQVLINAPTATADVTDAKNMFAQLRDTVMTFVDLDVNNTNNGDVNLSNKSTLVGTQYDTMQNDLQPAIDDIVSDLNDSVDATDKAVTAFSDAIDTDFNTAVSAISNRVSALADQIDDNNYDIDQNWSVTNSNNGDRLDHNVTVADGIRTHTFVFNDQTMIFKQTDENETEVKYVSGSVDIKDSNGNGNSYDLNITNVSFDGLKAIVIANGVLQGDNGASMNLSELNITSDLNTSVDNINALQNIAVAFDGTVTAAGRSLRGMISTDGLKTVLSGIFTGAENEPSFDGNVTLNTGLNSLLDNIALSDTTYVNGNSPVLVANFADGSDVVVGYTQEWVSSNDDEYIIDYNLTLQNHDNIKCETNTTFYNGYYDENNNYHWTDENNTVTCNDGVILTPYYTENGKITMKVNGEEKTLDGSWTRYVSDNGVDRHVQVFEFKDGSQTYHQGDKKLYLDGNEVTLSDVNLTRAPDLMDRSFDFKIEGAITDGARTVKASAGVIRDTATKIYAKNIEVSDASSYVKLAELSATLTNDVFIKNFGSTSGSDDEHGDYYWEHRFENYHVSYEDQNEDDGVNEDNVVAATLNGLKVSVVDNNNKTLTIDANISVENGDTIVGVFDGKYDYNSASFVGHIDTNLTQVDAANGDSYMTGPVNVSGVIEANGFEPFSILTHMNLRANNGVEAYGLFTRGSDNYKMGIYVDGSDENVTTRIGDTNGVLGNGFESDGHSFSMNVKDKDGNNLADVGETTNGNNWEIQYYDASHSSETLF